jgi:enolase
MSGPLDTASSLAFPISKGWLAARSILIKVNQIGTLMETLYAIELPCRNRFTTA